MSGEYRKGFWLTLTGVLAFTPDALLIRLTAVDPFTLTVGRGALAGTIIVLAYRLFVPGGFLNAFGKMGRWGILFVAVQATGAITFYLSFSFTSVANVLVIFACTPLIAAMFSKLLFGEGMTRSTQIAVVCVTAGLAVVASGSLDSGQWIGDALAMVNTVILGLGFAIIRGRRQSNLIPATAVGLLLAALIAAVFAEFPPLRTIQWLWLILGGAVLLPVALALITVGPRYLPAPEAAMLGLLETILGPFWVWLVIGENPGWRSMVGGSIVVTVLFVHALVRFRGERTQAAR